MPKAAVTFRGAKELLDLLDDMDEKLASRSLTRALKKAAPIVRDDAKRLASKETGALAQSITFVVQGRGTARFARIGPEKGARYSTPKGIRQPSKYAHLVENGHSGHVAPNPFLRPAVESNHDRVIQVMGESIATDIKRLAKRGRLKAGGQ